MGQLTRQRLCRDVRATTGKAFVDRLWSAQVPRSYWDGTLHMLPLLHVSGEFRRWY